MKLLFYILLLLSLNVFSQNIKGFYVNGFNTILGNIAKEDSVLNLAKNNGFNYITLYDVHIVHNTTSLTNTTTSQTFANFINKAKSQYSIAEVGVAAENYLFFKNVIHVYNQQHNNSNQKIDVYNYEFEFWIPSSTTTGSYYCNNYMQPNGLSCDTAGAFKHYKKELHKIDSLANSIGKKSEAYFGFFNNGQAKQIVQTGVDRVLLSIYITSANYSPTYQYGYIKPRLQALATASTSIKIIPLYSAEPNFMQTWVTANPYFTPYANLNTNLISESGIWKNFIQLEGIQWFAYSFMPKKNITTSILNKDNESNTDVIIYPNPSNGILNITIDAEKQEEITVTIIDILGQVVFSQAEIQNKFALKTNFLKSGVYFLSLTTSGKTVTKKVIIE